MATTNDFRHIQSMTFGSLHFETFGGLLFIKETVHEDEDQIVIVLEHDEAVALRDYLNQVLHVE